MPNCTVKEGTKQFDRWQIPEPRKPHGRKQRPAETADTAARNKAAQSQKGSPCDIAPPFFIPTSVPTRNSLIYGAILSKRSTRVNKTWVK
jgi:hypothetical protein